MLEAGKEQSQPDLILDNESGRAYCCKVCQMLICQVESQIQIDSKFEFSFFNPAGIVFTIGVFSQAENVNVLGEPRDEFSWFKGYNWQITLCQGCGNHLGWYYSGARNFFGLILTELVLLDI